HAVGATNCQTTDEWTAMCLGAPARCILRACPCRMKIAQLAPLHESVPPKLYGGSERVLSWLTEQLVRRGHEVMLLASGGYETSPGRGPVCARALRFDPNPRDPLMAQMLAIELVAQMADHFDVIHFHMDYLHLPVARRL